MQDESLRLRLTFDYLLNRKQRMSNSYISSMKVLFGVPQRLILGLFLFNIFFADLFFTVNSMDIANYVHKNTPYTTANDIDNLIASPEEVSKCLFTWFDNILIKSNGDE